MVGVANLQLIEQGVVKWTDVVTGQRVRDLREVVALKKLTVDRMTGAGVTRSVAERAYETVHTPAHELADQQRKELLQKVLDKGITKEQLKQALGARLAARVGVTGPGGPGTAPAPKPPPGPPPEPLSVEDRTAYLVKAKVKKDVADRIATDEAAAQAAAQAAAEAARKQAAEAAHAAELAALKAARLKAEAEAAAKASVAPAAWKPRKQSEFREFTNTKDMEAWGRESFGDWADGLTQPEKNAIKLYAQDNFKWMNAIERGEVPKASDLPYGLSMKGAREYIDRTIAPLARAKVDRDVVAFRGVKDVETMGIDRLTLKPGDELTVQGFGSLSMKKEVAADFAKLPGSTPRKAILQVNTPKGSTAAYLNAGELSGYDHERELLMPPGPKLRFVREGGTHKDVWGNETPILVFERVE